MSDRLSTEQLRDRVDMELDDPTVPRPTVALPEMTPAEIARADAFAAWIGGIR